MRPMLKLLMKSYLSVSVFALAFALLAGHVLADPNWRANGNSQAAASARDGGECVRENDWMRRNHMALLTHDRDLTVIDGIRDIDGSLSGCVECHANLDKQGHPVPVTDPGEFCAACHAFTGVSLNCFQCHASTPTE